MQCPRCGHALEADFGVVTCSQCQAVLFVDMEGHVQVSEENGGQHGEQNIVTPDVSESFADAAFEPAYAETFEAEPIEREAQFEPNEQAAEADFAIFDEPVEAGQTDASEMINDMSPAVIAPPEPQGPMPHQDLHLVQDFGDETSTRGPLSYHVTIAGIFTKEIREEVMHILKDPKFNWDPKELMKQIKDGNLILEDVNPIKASMLVRKLRELPLAIAWRQDVY